MRWRANSLISLSARWRWKLPNTLDFTLANLGYQFRISVPAGESAMSFLARSHERRDHALSSLTAKAQAQIEKSWPRSRSSTRRLLPHRLDIVSSASARKFSCRRGSAANSASVMRSASRVDPVSMELLFERFLSDERGEWPTSISICRRDQRGRASHVKNVRRVWVAMTGTSSLWTGRRR